MKTLRQIVLLFAMVCLVCPLAQSDAISDLQDAVKKLQSDVVLLQQANASLTAQLQDLKKAELVDTGAAAKRLDSLESVIQVGASVTIVSPGSLTVKAPATVSIQGAMIKLNGGSRAVAGVGHNVTNNVPPNANPNQITSGSPTVLIP